MLRLTFLFLLLAPQPAWAAEKNHPSAEFTIARGNGTLDRKFDERRLEELAETGSVPAMVDMAKRFLHGEGVVQNLGVGWYWLKRAQQENIDTLSITPKSLNHLLEEMNENERSALAYLAHFHNDLDLSGIRIPPSFLPLTSNTPEHLSDHEVATFIRKFEGLSRKNDNEKYNAIERELVSRAAGIRYLGNVSIDAQIRPFGMDNDQFVKRKCNYHQEAGKIFPQTPDQKGDYLRRREIALSSLFKKNFVQYISDILQCGRIYPNPVSRGMSEALHWAKKLEKMNLAALRKMSAKHLKESGAISIDKFKLGSAIIDTDNEFELFMHFRLAQMIREFADYKDQAKL